MHERRLYEYAVIRVVPRVDREEFVNAGVVLYCKSPRFIKVRFVVDEARLRLLWPGIDVDLIRRNLDSFERIAAGDPSAGPIARLEIAERFRWLTAVRSSVIQTSRPHPGLCAHPEEKVEQLLRELVL